MDKKNLKETIKADLYRYNGKHSSVPFLQGFKYPGFRYTYILRKCFYYNEKNSKIKFLFFYFFLKRYSYKFGFDISPFCKIGKGLYIGHFGRVIINEKAEIGCNVNISPGVTIGATYRGKNKGVPKIGNNVWIGTNAVVVGNIQVGDNVLNSSISFYKF